MRTMWIAMMLSIGMYYVFTILRGGREGVSPSHTLFLVLAGIGLLTTLISFLLKKLLLGRAIAQHQVGQVQQAYIVAWALTEVAALLGMLDFFVDGNRYYFILMIVAAAGQLLHFPRREDVLNASYNRSISA